MADLKNKVVDAEALERLVFDATLSPEAIVLAICAVLRDGSLPRHQAPRLRGSAEYRAGRSCLKRAGLASAPHSKPNELELFKEKFVNLFPKEVKVEKPKRASRASKASGAEKDAKPGECDPVDGEDERA